MNRHLSNVPSWLNSVICGDAAEEVARLPAASIDSIITSPPYFRQRDYSGDRQLGHEATPAEYIQRLVDIFAQCHRVLKDSGTAWIVLGDKYPDGQQLGMPWRAALALVDFGWILRSDIIWHKPNAMPSAVKTRPTTDHEYVFFFTKSKQYFYDADAIREPHVTFSEKSRMRGGRKHFNQRHGTPERGKNGGRLQPARRSLGSGFSSQGAEQANGLVHLAVQVSRCAFRRLPRATGGNVPAGGLPAWRPGARSFPGKWHDGYRRTASAAQLRRYRLCGGILPNGSPSDRARARGLRRCHWLSERRTLGQLQATMIRERSQCRSKPAAPEPRASMHTSPSRASNFTADTKNTRGATGTWRLQQASALASARE